MNFNAILSKLNEEGNLRKLPSQLPANVLDFSSNDYLGIAQNHELANEFIASLPSLAFSSSASRLLASQQEIYKNFERLLESQYQRPILLFNSGYHANTGVISAIANASNSLIILDKLAHASIIDGCVLSRADFKRFPHNDISALRKILEKNYEDYDNFIIISESVFSMDGDRAPLEQLLNLKQEFPKVFLYLDEAHAFGVMGRKGLGLAQDTTSPAAWDIIVCPMGKAAASMGAFVVCNEETKDFLINKARSLIFSTAIPPFQIEWSSFVISRILTMDRERTLLHRLSQLLADTIRKYYSVADTDISHIRPLIIGDSHHSIELSDKLFSHGIKALPIRRPTVPPGTERIRFSLSADMHDDDILKLDNALKCIVNS